MRTNFNMTDENITMVKGDTLAFNVEIKDNDGEPITVDSAYFTCKKNVAAVTPTFQKSLNNGIEQDDGLLTVRVAPADTSSLLAGQYYYDFQIAVGDDKYTLLRGILSLEQDVTA